MFLYPFMFLSTTKKVSSRQLDFDGHYKTKHSCPSDLPMFLTCIYLVLGARIVELFYETHRFGEKRVNAV